MWTHGFSSEQSCMYTEIAAQVTLYTVSLFAAMYLRMLASSAETHGNLLWVPVTMNVFWGKFLATMQNIHPSDMLAC